MALRLIFLILCGITGLIFVYNVLEIKEFYVFGLIGASVTAVVGLLLEYGLRRLPVKAVGGAALGLIFGVAATALIFYTMKQILPSLDNSPFLWQLFPLLLLSYIGVATGMRLGSWEQSIPSRTGLVTSGLGPTNKILDTSVIIEGRIADLCETGFLEGSFILPNFILQELQHIADSSDSMKRARGRRGLDILHRIQKMVDIDVQIVDNDYPSIRKVDAKLVALAREIGAKIMTNDLNLNKVAELQGVQVLNINDLSNALKPVVLPGESIRVFILKEGKENGQGVGYLDDGTMIVVDHAKRLIGKTADVVVTSVLQTTAGRMIFTRVRENSEREKEEVHAAHG